MNCTIQRWRLSKALNERRVPAGSLAAHLASCPACRHHFEAGSIIEGRLANPAHAPSGAPPFLHARIMAGVRAAESAPVRAATAHRAWAWAAAAAAMAVVALLPLMHPPAPPAVAASPGDLYDRGIEAVSANVPSALSAPMERQVAFFREDLARTADFLLAQVR